MQRTDTLAESPVRFDLIDIVQTILRRRNFILLVAGLAFLAGLAVYFGAKPKYEAGAEIIVSNPLHSDRMRVFSKEIPVPVDYFANEQSTDRALAVAGSDQVVREVVRRNNMIDVYKLRRDNPVDFEAAVKRVRSSLKVRRTEFGSIQIFFTDIDPKRAAQVTNSAVSIIQENFQHYFSGIRINTAAALQKRIAYGDSVIRTLTDSLVALRERTGFYDIVSPNRPGLIVGSLRSTNARAIEEIQNLESIKDQYVIDRSRYISMAAESNTGIDETEMPIVRVISPAETPGVRSGLSLVMTLVTYTLVGLLFGVVWAVLSGWFHRLWVALQTRRDEA